jgi:putative oxidoreductase
MQKLLSRYEVHFYALARLVVGALFACHGAQKLFGVLGGQSEVNDPEGLIAGIIEFFGGILVSTGLLTRSAAFVASGEMAVAYFKAHAGRGFWPIMNHGELAVLYAFFFLYVSVRGHGVWSVDAVWEKLSPKGSDQTMQRTAPRSDA